MCAAIYAFTGLLVSLTQFGVGIAIAMAAIIVYGATDFIESRNNERRHRERIAVWHRRDLEASQANAVKNVYGSPRDGLNR